MDTGLDMDTDPGNEPVDDPGRPRRRADAQRNVDAIISATRDLLSHGALPSMSEIASAAGVGRVTLYSHFASREALLDAVVRRAMTDTDQALAGLALDTDPPEVALARLVRTSWPILDRYRTVRAVAVTELGAEALRGQHDRVVHHVERLIARGQDDGAFRADLPGPWLVALFYATLHTAADEVSAGRLDSRTAPDVLVATLQSILRRS
jgi:AcrR family transcriptional regulator